MHAHGTPSTTTAGTNIVNSNGKFALMGVVWSREVPTHQFTYHSSNGYSIGRTYGLLRSIIIRYHRGSNPMCLRKVFFEPLDRFALPHTEWHLPVSRTWLRNSIRSRHRALGTRTGTRTGRRTLGTRAPRPAFGAGRAATCDSSESARGGKLGEAMGSSDDGRRVGKVWTYV